MVSALSWFWWLLALTNTPVIQLCFHGLLFSYFILLISFSLPLAVEQDIFRFESQAAVGRFGARCALPKGGCPAEEVGAEPSRAACSQSTLRNSDESSCCYILLSLLP